MTHTHKRPDPDALLSRLRAEEAKAKRGSLRVFLGFAPGVGKTYRMLSVARDLVAEQKLDVVVGIVETHKRMETAALTLGLEILPRRKVEVRGIFVEEFDLDGALERRPKVLLVDELAHTNAEGSRHPKRWQDVLELLDAGIDVLTTINIQHLESLHDVVAQITHVSVRERVPDSVLDGADVVELVDIAPEELLVRLAEGKVYLPEQAKRAADHFFRLGNLLALRELALRRTAEHVDEDVQQYREAHGVVATWPLGERILVCVGPAPSSERLVRAASRMAARQRCPWIAAYVEPTRLQLGQRDRDRLERHLLLAESLGGAVARLSEGRISDALLEYARAHNVTRIVIGKPTHSRLLDRLRGSLLDEVVRGSGDIDVHVISGIHEERKGDGGTEPLGRASAPTSHYLGAAGLVAASTTAALLLRDGVNLPDPEMLFLLAVMGAGLLLGRGPALLAAALSVAAYNFFFVPPFYTFDVADPRYWLTFGMMFAIGFVVSELAARLRAQREGARQREQQTASLYALGQELSSADVPVEIARTAARHGSDVFQRRCVVLHADGEGTPAPLASWPEGTTLDTGELAVAKWALSHGAAAGTGTDTLTGSSCLATPLTVGGETLGVFALLMEDKRALYADQRAFLDVFCRQVATTLERARLAHKARSMTLRAKTEEMRASLLSAVSHDLRTPLASITLAATSLRDDPALPDGLRTEWVGPICREAERLELLVANLLDMTRLESGALDVHRDWVPLEEIVGSALTRLERVLGDREVTVRLQDGIPLLFVDPVLWEQVWVNLLDNAHKYAPRPVRIEIEAALTDAGIEQTVRDCGPGLVPGEEEQVFEKFYRGRPSAAPGAGLGLAICRGIVEAHGGTISAENHPRGGALFRVVLPLLDPPKSSGTTQGATP